MLNIQRSINDLTLNDFWKASLLNMKKKLQEVF